MKWHQDTIIPWIGQYIFSSFYKPAPLQSVNPPLLPSSNLMGLNTKALAAKSPTGGPLLPLI